MCIDSSLLRRLVSYKVSLCFIVLLVTVYTVGYVCLFSGDQIFVDFVRFLSMIIYSFIYIIFKVLYNICSALFLDIRISAYLFSRFTYIFVKPGVLSSGWRSSGFLKLLLCGLLV